MIIKDDNKNNGITIITKNDDTADYPFISICGQNGYRRQKIRVLLAKIQEVQYLPTERRRMQLLPIIFGENIG